jgi:competence/damage-inducible protein CinA-like protein
MASAEIIAIGTELLLGMTQDTNTCYLANQLRSIGVDLYRTTVIGDNEERITQLVKEALARADIVITTGGLGPTIDDPTRSAIANVYGVPLDFQPELWELILERFKNYGRVATENNKRQAYLPRNAKVILNPVGTAPAFSILENHHLLVSLPGVPREMEYLFQNNVSQLILDTFPEHAFIVTKIVHLIGIGESHVDQLIGDLELLHNPTVGLSAKSGQIDIRITAKAFSKVDAEELIDPILRTLHEKLDPYIFSEDNIPLIQVIENLLEKNKTPLDIYFFNHTFPELATVSPWIKANPIEEIIPNEQSLEKVLPKENKPDQGIKLAFAIFEKPDKMELHGINISDPESMRMIRTHLGPKEDFPQWLHQNELGYLFTLLKS